MEHKTITTKRGTIHYWTKGEGQEGLLFTHGATMDHGLFEYQIDPIFQSYKLITWDVPCHGLSRPYEDFSLQYSADDLYALLVSEKINKAHLVGQSMGGYISQIAAADHPNIIASVTTVGSSPIQIKYYSRMDRWLLSITPALLKLYSFKSLINLTANQITLNINARNYAFNTLSLLSKAEIIHIMGSVYRGLVEYDKDKLSCPLLITYGDADKTGKVKAYCDRWASEEGRPLKIISNSAHNANMDNPNEFNQILAEFIKNISNN